MNKFFSLIFPMLFINSFLLEGIPHEDRQVLVFSSFTISDQVSIYIGTDKGPNFDIDIIHDSVSSILSSDSSKDSESFYVGELKNDATDISPLPVGTQLKLNLFAGITDNNLVSAQGFKIPHTLTCYVGDKSLAIAGKADDTIGGAENLNKTLIYKAPKAEKTTEVYFNSTISKVDLNKAAIGSYSNESTLTIAVVSL